MPTVFREHVVHAVCHSVFQGASVLDVDPVEDSEVATEATEDMEEATASVASTISIIWAEKKRNEKNPVLFVNKSAVYSASLPFREHAAAPLLSPHPPLLTTRPVAGSVGFYPVSQGTKGFRP